MSDNINNGKNLFSVSPLGVITVDTSSIKAEVEQNYLNAFGNELNLEVSTPQGQLINNDIALLKGIQEDLLDLANSFSPYTAINEELDVIGSIFGYYRKVNIPTIVYASLKGKANTIVPKGSVASDSKYDYKLLDTVLIGESGSVDNCIFECITTGEIICLKNTLTIIKTKIDGWEEINNNSDGITGFREEVDNVFRQRITANWLNIRANGLLPAIVDNITQLNDVISIKANENPTNITKTIDGISMEPHSVYLSILGGKEEDIAEIIYNKKTLGTSMNGDTIIEYKDNKLNYSYSYKIFRPKNIPIKIKINYSINNITPVNIEELLKQQLISYIQNNPFNIGQTISGNFLTNAFNNYDFANILSIKIKYRDKTNDYTDYITFSNLEVPSFSQDDLEFNREENN